MAKVKAFTTKQTKTQILRSIAEETELPLADVKAVFASLDSHIQRHLMKRGSGEFTIPDVGVKVVRHRKPRTKARMGRNPATGEEIKIGPKPAKTVVKVRAMKHLKDMIA